MAWLELTVQTKAIYTERMSDFLEQQTKAASVTWQSANEEALFEPDLNTTPLWQCVYIRALYTNDRRLSDVINSLKGKFGKEAILDCYFKPVVDKVWERVWLDDLSPMCFGKRLWVCPKPFEPPDPTGITVRLDPGLAFGTGTHPSTALCLEWIDAQLLSDKTVIDYGCGSGILSIAALKCGARQVLAVDHDPQAIEATKENAMQNIISSEHISCLLPHQLKRLKTADILFANILAGPLIALAEAFKQLLKEEGQCVLAGILREQVADVHRSYVAAGFTLIDTQYKQDWARLVVRR